MHSEALAPWPHELTFAAMAGAVRGRRMPPLEVCSETLAAGRERRSRPVAPTEFNRQSVKGARQRTTAPHANKPAMTSATICAPIANGDTSGSIPRITPHAPETYIHVKN